jgi:hypothetical protein
MTADLRLVDGLTDSDRDTLSAGKVLTPRVVMLFDLERLADALGITHAALIARMVKILAGALAVDAAEMADMEMQMQGRRFGLDGFPDGWPYEHLAAVTQHRLFPELAQ